MATFHLPQLPQCPQFPQPQIQEHSQHPQRMPQMREDEQWSYKNRLYEYSSRAGLDLPVYHTRNEASEHAPQFKCYVIVDGETYESSQAFCRKKVAEQDAARCAFEGILKKRVEKGSSIIRKNIASCKSILNEFAAKLQVQRPKYSTVQTQVAPVSVFVSSLEFRGVSHTGQPAKKKREAEQTIAHDTVISILDESQVDTSLLEIIKLKAKRWAHLQASNEPNCAKIVEETSNSRAVNGDYTGKEVPAGSNVLMQTSKEKQFKDDAKACGLQTEGFPVPPNQSPVAPLMQSFAREGSASQADKFVPQTAGVPPVSVPSTQDHSAPCDTPSSKITSASSAGESVHQTPGFPVVSVPSVQEYSGADASHCRKITSASQAVVCVPQVPAVLPSLVPSMQFCSLACRKRNRKNKLKAKKRARAAM